MELIDRSHEWKKLNKRHGAFDDDDLLDDEEDDDDDDNARLVEVIMQLCQSCTMVVGLIWSEVHYP